MWVVVLLLLSVPAAIFAVVYAICCSKIVGRADEAYGAAVFFSGLIGVLFDAMLLITGVFSDGFAALKNRWKDFFSDLGIDLKLAVSGYIESLKSDGVVFFVYFAIVAATCVWLAYGTELCVEFVRANGGF